MSELTFTLADGAHARLRRMAAARGVSVEALLAAVVDRALAGEARRRFVERAGRGQVGDALRLLDRLERRG